MSIVTLKNVMKRFSDGSKMTILFNHMNFDVAEGELVVITGEEKSGKTTLLQMIAAMTPPNKGSVEVFGENLLHIKKRPQWRLDNIGFITDEGCLVPYLTAKQNLLLGVPADDTSYLFKEKQAEKILAELGFTKPMMNETLEGLDTKEQVLATVARVFMTTPRLILADEPTKMLIGHEGHEVLRKIIRFAKKQNATLIIVSNDPTIIQESDRFFKLEHCTLVEKNSEALH
ncbi:putative ABC transport system ATP-binding protein [Evansella caseinilytica]|uniref:Putative hemin import ATP-binding protein HrtA n=1 Tax=Evansella caseinilytica TaxID=1503961 RepID=A0A1H3MR01_9BACI|nr:ATP-binding cassette domain-containing protein [Evansella caseinilytica]SDY79162.1 putative ABC transport system ATP-binding protein [Evansella caseinilytica]